MVGMAQGSNHALGTGIGWTVLVKVGRGPALCTAKGMTRGKTSVEGRNVGGEVGIAGTRALPKQREGQDKVRDTLTGPYKALRRRGWG